MKGLKYISLFILCLAFGSCSDKQEGLDNPYDKESDLPQHDKVFTEEKELALGNIEGLHHYIFRPTCANSGCHDGNFEPDFRTIQSTYNSLVNQPIIKNSTSNPLEFRVKPGESNASMLMTRMEIDLNGNSGIMPLLLETDSDWPTYKTEYIQRVKNWIDGGALDINGNPPPEPNYPPLVQGFLAKQNGVISSRAGKQESIFISKSGGTAELWFAVLDYETATSDIQFSEVDSSINPQLFSTDQLVNVTYQATPINHKGFGSSLQDYHFKATIDLSAYEVGDVIWIRTHVSDGTHDILIPNDNSIFDIQQYFTLRLIQ